MTWRNTWLCGPGAVRGPVMELLAQCVFVAGALAWLAVLLAVAQEAR